MGQGCFAAGTHLMDTLHMASQCPQLSARSAVCLHCSILVRSTLFQGTHSGRSLLYQPLSASVGGRGVVRGCECVLTVRCGSSLTGVYSAPKGMTALVASMRLFGHTFHASRTASFCSSSANDSELDIVVVRNSRGSQAQPSGDTAARHCLPPSCSSEVKHAGAKHGWIR